MSNRDRLTIAVTHQVRDTCMCLHVQRAARAVARRFDEALRPLDLTSGQFSLLMSLNRPEPASIGGVSALLAMDRTTLTANLKPLRRRGLLEVTVDGADRRGRRLRGARPLRRAPRPPHRVRKPPHRLPRAGRPPLERPARSRAGRS
jgi:hypothetical protein